MATPPAATTTPAAAPATQTPQAGGATTPIAPAPKPAQESRFSRDKGIGRQGLLDEIGNPLLSNKTVTSYRYPESLGSNEEFPHWVAFYPLVRENSKYAKNIADNGFGRVFNQTGLDEKGEKTVQNRVDPQNAAIAAGASGALAGAALGLGAALSNSGGKSTSPDGGTSISPVQSILTKLGRVGTGVIGGGVVGGLAGVLASEVAGVQRAIFGDTEIILHVSERVSASYSANWSEAELGGLVGALASGKFNVAGAFDVSKGIDFSALALQGGELGDYALRKVAKVAGLTGFDQLQNVIEATSKRVENPYKEQLFRSMGFRKFMFDYKFSPRTASEAEHIFGIPGNPNKEGIIGAFLRHMHPTQSSTGLFLSYPSEFLIVYYHNGKENQYTRKISNCALINMAIDYGSEGFTTFADGVPTEATIRLEFVELETLTAERIQEGF